MPVNCVRVRCYERAPYTAKELSQSAKASVERRKVPLPAVMCEIELSAKLTKVGAWACMGPSYYVQAYHVNTICEFIRNVK